MDPEDIRKEKEGKFLLGVVKFEDLGSGRVRCIETGHEMPEAQKDSYGQNKKCRVALIDFALARRKAPLNFFEQSSIARDKVVCQLTGDTINKTEEALWKHITGKKFHRKLAQKEAEKKVEREEGSFFLNKSKQLMKNHNESAKKDCRKMEPARNPPTEIEHGDQSTDSEETGFWVPPVGDRWDCDFGDNRWSAIRCPKKGSKKACPIVNDANIEDGDKTVLQSDNDPGEEAIPLSGGSSAEDDVIMRTKRMSIAVGPSSFAGRKKKRKTKGEEVMVLPV